jgi:hypothetical protein
MNDELQAALRCGVPVPNGAFTIAQWVRGEESDA